MMGKIALIILLCFLGHSIDAQEFEVRSFRCLTNDITAWVDPVRDLNDEACALIKVVGDPDFVFSTPLGIVARKNEVGEIWIYVPHRTMKLTIKHPRWGVLRDYRFPSALESRLTYELVIAPPPEKVQEKPYPEVLRRSFRGLENTPLDYSLRAVSGGELRGRKPTYFVLATLGIHEGEIANGVRFGGMRKHGVWLHVQSNFRFLSTAGKCNQAGELVSGEPTPYYKSSVSRALNTVTAGGIHRVIGLLHVYEGVGYGEQRVVWETLEGVKLQNTDYSVKGVAGEVGVLMEVRRVAVSLGVLTIRGEYWEPVLGVGINF